MQPYVLVVEDEDALSTLLEYNFQKEGYEVGLAMDGEEALVMAAERTPDIILMDWMLPKLSGVEACRRLRRREETRNTPVIMLTARGDERPTEFRLLDHFMRHPGRVFSREQLLDAVWGRDVYVEARTVDVHIGRLRKALKKNVNIDPIRTVRSAGYAFEIAN